MTHKDNGGISKRNTTKAQETIGIILLIPVVVAAFVLALGLVVAAISFLMWALSTL